MVSLCGVILAAGASSRMGRDKALLPWPARGSASHQPESSTLLSAHIAALKPFTDAVIVVAGHNAERIAQVISASGAQSAINPAPERGQFSSLQIGLKKALELGYNSAVITPVDCAPLDPETLALLRLKFNEARPSGQWAVSPHANGRNGHPLFITRELIDAFLAAPPTSNAREVKRVHAARFVSVAVSIPTLAADMNTPAEYAAMIAKHR